MDRSLTKTPWHLWVVALLVMVLFGWGAGWGLWFLLTGPLDTIIDVVWLVGLVAAVLGSAALLMHHKAALILFGVVVVAALVSAGVPFLPGTEEPWLPVVAVNVAMLLVGGCLLLLYARSMVRRGVLR